MKQRLAKCMSVRVHTDQGQCGDLEKHTRTEVLELPLHPKLKRSCHSTPLTLHLLPKIPQILDVVHPKAPFRLHGFVCREDFHVPEGAAQTGEQTVSAFQQ